MLKTVAKVIGAIFLIVLGILFLAYLQRAPTEVASDAIFIGAGLLLIRSAYLDGKSAKAAATAQTAKGARKKTTK